MIFVTVGSMLPFDRLIRAVDLWAQNTKCLDVFAQIGDGVYEPTNMTWARMLSPGEFDQKIRSASLVVAHAGMGSIISAMEAGKPIVILPRRVENKEVTTNHQVDTVTWLEQKSGIYVARTEAALPEAISNATHSSGSCAPSISSVAPEQFIQRVRSYLVS
ncbi:MAG: glycosyltransferase [Pseudomonadota bacterium]